MPRSTTALLTPRSSTLTAVLLALGVASAGRPGRWHRQLKARYNKTVGPYGRGPDPDPVKDCAFKKIGLDYAQKIQPDADLRSVFDALQLPGPREPADFDIPRTSGSGGCIAYVTADAGSAAASGGLSSDPGQCNDELSPFSTIHAALDAVRKAISSASTSATTKAIVLRRGVHYLTETLALTPADSGLLIQNFPHEEAWVSGGRPLRGLAWARVNASSPVLVADLSSANVPDLSSITDITGLNTLGGGDGYGGASGFRRLTRARYPNKDPTCGSYERAWLNTDENTSWLHTPHPAKAVQAVGAREKDDAVEYNQYVYGVGGECGMYAEGGAYLCSNQSSGGWFGMDTLGPMFPKGLAINTFDDPARNKLAGKAAAWDPRAAAPSSSSAPAAASAAALEGAVVHEWANGWCTVMYEVRRFDGRTGRFNFSRGGFQTGRGYHTNNLTDPQPYYSLDGEQWRVENLLVELDADEEWYYDKVGRKLYLQPNATRQGEQHAQQAGDVDTTVEPLVAAQLQVLVSLKGEGQGESDRDDDPLLPTRLVEGVTIRGVGFRDAAYSYLEPHGVPSGGDWALQRSGALLMEGTRHITVTDCVFDKLDGNAVMLSGLNHNNSIARSDFRWVGDSAIAAWGYTKQGNLSHPSSTTTTAASSSPSSSSSLQSASNMSGGGGSAEQGHEQGQKQVLPPGVGVDGTNGNQPRGTRVLYNTMRELGTNQKQSSPWFQAKSCENTIEGNIMYNLPRAAINFNDGFGGGTEVTRNVLFNTCRESSDHGPPFLTTVRDGKTPSLIKAWDDIHHNYIISNYGAGWGVDNDDGSAYYRVRDNVMYQGGGLKSDYGGHAKWFYRNLFIECDQCADVCNEFVHKKVNASGGRPAREIDTRDYFFNNTCVQSAQRQNSYISMWFCGKDGPNGVAVFRDNRVFQPNRTVTAQVQCGIPDDAVLPLARFQKEYGGEKGTTFSHEVPSTGTIVAQARAMLGM